MNTWFEIQTLTCIQLYRRHFLSGQILQFPTKAKDKILINRNYQYDSYLVEKRASMLSKTLDCDQSEAVAFLNHHSHIQTMGFHKYNRIVKLFAAHRLEAKEVFTYPDVFKRNCDTLDMRFQQLREAGVKQVKLSQVNTSLAAFTKRLMMFQHEKNAKEVYSDVPMMVMSVLGCSRQEALALIKSNRILKTSKLSTLKAKLELLLTQAVAPKTLLEKAWILTWPIKTLELRSKLLRKHGITFQKCPKSFFFLMKCSLPAFERNVNFWREELSLLGGSPNKEDFLCKILQCEKHQIDILQRSYPKILRVSAVKLYATLTFLKSQNVSTDDIIANGRVFSFSTETLVRRYSELGELGLEPISASILSMDSRRYKKLVEKLKCQIV